MSKYEGAEVYTITILVLFCTGSLKKKLVLGGVCVQSAERYSGPKEIK
jgi:hypothetical protein